MRPSLGGLNALAGVSPTVVPYTPQEIDAAEAAQQSDARAQANQGMAEDQAAGVGAEASMENDREAGLNAASPFAAYVAQLSALPYAAAARGFKENVLGAPSMNPAENMPGLESDTLTTPALSGLGSLAGGARGRRFTAQVS